MTAPVYTGVVYTSPSSAGRVGGMCYDPFTNALYAIIVPPGSTNTLVKLNPNTLVEQSRLVLSFGGNFYTFGELLMTDNAGHLYLDCTVSPYNGIEVILKIDILTMSVVGAVTLTDNTGNNNINFQVATIDPANGWIYWQGVNLNNANLPIIVKKINTSSMTVSATNSFVVDQSLNGNVFTGALSSDTTKLYLISGEGTVWGGVSSNLVVVDTGTLTSIGSVHNLGVDGGTGAVDLLGNIYLTSESSGSGGTSTFAQISDTTFTTGSSFTNQFISRKEIGVSFAQEYDVVNYDPLQEEIYIVSHGSGGYIAELGMVPFGLGSITSLAPYLFTNGANIHSAISPATFLYVGGDNPNISNYGKILQFAIGGGYFGAGNDGFQRIHSTHSSHLNLTTRSVSHSSALNQNTSTQSSAFRRPPVTAASLAAGAGEPHFVGFDGERFDYHGEKDCKYLLFDDGELRIEARLTEPDLNIGAHLKDTTYITELLVNGKVFTPNNLTQKTEHEVTTESGMIRGLPPVLEFVQGGVYGMEIIKFSKGEVILTSMDSAGGHLNIAFKLSQLNFKANGVIGQTLIPKNRRRMNDYFKL